MSTGNGAQSWPAAEDRPQALDATHLELSQPLEASRDNVVDISLRLENDDETAAWRDAGKEHSLDAYADEDAVYDELRIRRRRH